MTINTLYNLLAYVVSICAITVLIFIVLRGSSSRHKNAFIVYSISTALWLGLQCLAQFVLPQSPVSLLRLATSMGLTTATTFYVFAKVLSQNGKKPTNISSKRSLILLFLVGLLFIAGLTPLSITEATASTAGLAITQAGVVYGLQVLLAFGLFIAGIVVLIRRFKKVDKDLQGPIRLIIYSVIFAVVINAVGAIFFASSQQSQALVTLSQLVIVFALYRSIQKYRLFDLRSFVARSFAYGTVILIVSTTIVLAILFVSRYIFDLSNASTEQRAVLDAVAVIFAVLIYSPLRAYFDKIATKLFYAYYYDPQIILSELNAVLISGIDIHIIMPKAIHILKQALGLQNLLFIHEAGTVFMEEGGINKIPEHKLKELYGLATATREQYVSRESHSPNYHDIKPYFTSENLEAISMVDLDSEKPGIFLWGQKLNGTPFTDKDISFVRLVSNELAIALQNTLRFEQIQNFNITLQKRVDDATRELKQSNEKLKALDEAKDEFISMASHQLRTPLTSIKGYLSLVLEGDVGKISAQQRVMLAQAFVSSQRMVYLIADLLNVSRLRTGKFLIEAKPTYLPDVVSDELLQVAETARARKVKINYKKPARFPTLQLDDTKIRQVIVNFVDNAIYYTPAGGEIEIKLTRKHDLIECLVIDNGIGVPKDEQHKLFTKFFRAGNARKARPDGTGLGLFMAKKVIASSGGTLIFKTQEGKGSTFGFSFPLVTTHQKD